MKIEGIINVSGKPGLHKIISQSKNAIIVESLTDKKRMPIYSHTKANSLEEISIYTNDDTIDLINVFENIYKKEKGEKCIDHKSSKDDLEGYFREILKEYDEDRVYLSDIKKIIQWYNILISSGFKFQNTNNEKNDKNKNSKET